ncbi:MAG: FAD-dependent monooxygenase [Anaerolineae bacterium]|nr:FAD-dependent monooxygenase [Anaerolineae bacterium]
MIRTDVVIVGGGPAGAACAWALRRQGIDCLVVDRVPFPRVKLCAGWVTPDVFRDLSLDEADYPYAITHLTGLRLSLRGIRLRLPSHQMAIRRVEFDDFLLRRAAVPVHTHHVREIVRRDGGYMVDGRFFGRYLVGAGGTNCPVARTLFDDVNPRLREALIVTQEEEFAYRIADDARARTCHLWFFEDGLPGYAWYVPKEGGYANVGVGGALAKLQARGDTIQRHWDLLTSRLSQLGLVENHDYRPAGHAYYLRQPERRHRRARVQLDHAFVAGDAAGLATTDMGEGIAPAIQSGLRVAEAIVTGKEATVADIRRLSQSPLIGRLLSAVYR